MLVSDLGQEIFYSCLSKVAWAGKESRLSSPEINARIFTNSCTAEIKCWMGSSFSFKSFRALYCSFHVFSEQ